MLGLSQPAIADEQASPVAVSDALLVTHAQSDPAALAALYDTYFDPVYRSRWASASCNF